MLDEVNAKLEELERTDDGRVTAKLKVRRTVAYGSPVAQTPLSRKQSNAVSVFKS